MTTTATATTSTTPAPTYRPLLVGQLDERILRTLSERPEWWDSRVGPRLADDGDCLIWTGALTGDGYGRVGLPRATPYEHAPRARVHRVAYLRAFGPIPTGLVVDHLCRVRACARLDHLEAVSPYLNAMRGDTVAADHAHRSQCPAGHPLTGPGADLVPAAAEQGRRVCRRCERTKRRERASAIAAACRALGLTKREYVARFGWSLAVAERGPDGYVRRKDSAS